jgi:hypothetical protein
MVERSVRRGCVRCVSWPHHTSIARSKLYQRRAPVERAERPNVRMTTKTNALADEEDVPCSNRGCRRVPMDMAADSKHKAQQSPATTATPIKA